MGATCSDTVEMHLSSVFVLACKPGDKGTVQFQWRPVHSDCIVFPRVIVTRLFGRPVHSDCIVFPRVIVGHLVEARLFVAQAHRFISVTACDEAFYSHAIEEYCLSKFKFDMDALGQRYWCEWEETVGKSNTLALACPDLVTHFSVLCLALNSVLEDMCSLPDRLQSCSWSEDILTQRRGCETQKAYSGLLSETETKLTSPLQSIDSSHTTVNMSVGSTRPGSADLTSGRSYGELTNCTFLIAEKLECYWPNRLVDEFFIGIHKLYFRNCSLSGRSLSDPPNSILGPFIVVPILVTLLVTALVVWRSKRSEGII
ncbi:UNVERIFIED_CONTAM: hypothetical protein FKN15_067940 [Acipenser sinensis]